MIGPGVNANATVTLNQPAPPGGIVLTLTSSNKAATVAKSVTVPPKSSSIFTVQGTGVASVTVTLIRPIRDRSAPVRNQQHQRFPHG